MTIDEVNTYLKASSSEKFRNNTIKLGIPAENTIGVPISELRKFARKLPLGRYENWAKPMKKQKL